MSRIERFLRWLFRPRQHTVDLAAVQVDGGRGVITSKPLPPNALSLSVSYGTVVASGRPHSLGACDVEVRGSCRVQAVVEEPWGLHKWWLARTSRRAA